MTAPRPRDRIAAALGPGTRGHTPAVVPYMGLFLRDHWDEVIDRPWWTWEYGSLAERCDVLEAMANATGADWAPVGLCAERGWRSDHHVKEQSGQAFLVSRRTGEAGLLERPPVGGRQYQSSLVRPRVHRAADVDAQVPITSADDLDHTGRLDLIRAAKARLGDRLCLLAPVPAPLWATHGYLGFHAMMTSLVEAPDLVDALTRRITDAQIERVKAYGRTGVDCVWIEDCMTSSDLISPQHFRAWHAPRVAEITAAVRAAGMHSVYYFCGDPWDRIEDIVGAGADAVSFEESKKGFDIDIDAVEQAVGGRCAILGNLDAIGVLQDGTTQQLRDEVQRQLDVGRRTGRFVASLGSPVTPATPTPRVREFTELVRELSA